MRPSFLVFLGILAVRLFGTPAIVAAGVNVQPEALPEQIQDESAAELTTPSGGHGTLNIYWENDSQEWKPNDSTDRYYTQALKVTWAYHPAWADDVAQLMDNQWWLRLDSTGLVPDTAAGFLFAQEFFTPEAISSPVQDPDDRPWAGWLYRGTYFQRATETVFDHFELDLGVVGSSSQAESIQEWIHHVFGQLEPRGWDNQLGDEFGINFIYRRKWKLLITEDPSAGFRAELIPQLGFTAGTVTRQVTGGLTTRAGWILPADFGPGRLADVAAATGPRRSVSRGGYGFVRLGGRLVEHDLFLEGSTHRDSHSVSARVAVGEVQVGVMLYCGNWELGYSQTFISEEFTTQNGGHSIGAYVLSWTTDF